MTDLLNGPIEERTHAQAKARVPMNGAQVRGIIQAWDKARAPLDARQRTAELALRLGNLSADGRAVYQAYLDSLK